MEMKTKIESPKVAFKSAVGTALKYSTPMLLAITGSRSTGTRSIKFIKKMYTNKVSPSAPTELTRSDSVSRTWLSTNSTSNSREAWNLPGVLTDANFAQRAKGTKNIKPSRIEINMVSRWRVKKLPLSP